MTKYRVVIEFETDRPLKFLVDAALLHDMQAQLESLNDGTYVTMTTPIQVKIGDSKISEVTALCSACGDIYCSGYHPEHEDVQGVDES